ncbi:MAG: hypothetical protein ACXACC_00385 [Promethearchaeota archaeon]
MKRTFELNEEQKTSKRYEGIGVSFFIKKYIAIHQKLRENLKDDDRIKNNQAHHII